MTKRELVLKVAQGQLGVMELKEGSNPKIEEYHRYATIKNDKGVTDDVPWCSSFMCWVFETAGLTSTNSRAARSWLKYGTPVESPKIGDLVIFWREDINSGKGHVGLFMGFTKVGNILVLGGNQKDQVCVRIYPVSQLLGFRSY